MVKVAAAHVPVVTSKEGKLDTTKVNGLLASVSTT